MAPDDGRRGGGTRASALSLIDRDDVAYRVLLQETCPSWLCSVKNGATTLWENWDGWTPERGFRDPSANSFNHYGFGSVGEWMYATIGGIAFDRDAPGGKHFLIRPRPGADLSHARMKLDSAHGPITSDWRLAEGTFHLSLTIPANTTATVSLPSGGPVTEGAQD